MRCLRLTLYALPSILLTVSALAQPVLTNQSAVKLPEFSMQAASSALSLPALEDVLPVIKAALSAVVRIPEGGDSDYGTRPGSGVLFANGSQKCFLLTASHVARMQALRSDEGANVGFPTRVESVDKDQSIINIEWSNLGSESHLSLSKRVYTAAYFFKNELHEEQAYSVIPSRLDFTIALSEASKNPCARINLQIPPIGEVVMIAGVPDGDVHVGAGKVFKLDGVDSSKSFGVDLLVPAGTSGGGVFNKDGGLIGVVVRSGWSKQYNRNVSIVVPLSNMRSEIERDIEFELIDLKITDTALNLLLKTLGSVALKEIK
ncbi:MAG: serine protease [Proteobacteria bacterium]|nr:MAG: serine protease [Pseudomonadota bacterium]